MPWARRLLLVIILAVVAKHVYEAVTDALSPDLEGLANDLANGKEQAARRAAALQKAHQHERDMALAVTTGDVSTVRALISHPNIDINADVRLGGSSGTLLFRVASIPETAASIEIAQLLLKHPRINPNGGSTSWTPLKAALHASNTVIVSELVSHPRTLKQVRPDGLSCSVVVRTPPSVAFVVSKTTPQCFKNHRATVLEGSRDEVPLSRVQEDHDKSPHDPKASRQFSGISGRAAKDAAGGRSADGKAATTAGGARAGGTAGVSPLPSVSRVIPAPSVVNPEGFSSFADVALYYTAGRVVRHAGALRVVGGAWAALCGVIVVSCCMAAVRRKDQDAAAAAPQQPAAAPPPGGAGDAAAPPPAADPHRHDGPRPPGHYDDGDAADAADDAEDEQRRRGDQDADINEPGFDHAADVVADAAGAAVR